MCFSVQGYMFYVMRGVWTANRKGLERRSRVSKGAPPAVWNWRTQKETQRDNSVLMFHFA